MKDFFQRSGGLLLIIAFLLTILVGTSSILMKGSTDPVTNVMGVLATPFRKVSSSVADFGEGVYAFVMHYEEMEEKVQELLLEVARLEKENRGASDSLRENEQLRELLELRAKKEDFVFESARVMTRSFTGWESVLTLDKGRKHGVEEGDAVVTESGYMVGIVSNLGENWCSVSTIISIDTKLGGVVARTNSAGVLEGEFSLMSQGLLKLSYLPEDAYLVAGDEVLTSGVGMLYPEGLSVGKIQGVFNDATGVSRFAVVEPNADFQHLVEVFVIKDFDLVN